MSVKPKSTKQLNRETSRDAMAKTVNKLRRRLTEIAEDIDRIHIPDTTQEYALKQEASVVGRLADKGQAKIDKLQAEIDRLEAKRGK